MYFPYLRGRQYELLALRELASESLISKNVIPIIEPVKDSNTLASVLETYYIKNLPLSIVINPQVGDMKVDILSRLDKAFKRGAIPSLIMSKEVTGIINKAQTYGIFNNDIIAIIKNYDDAILYNRLFCSDNSKYVLFPDERDIRRIICNKNVLFEDKFNRKERNVDYTKVEDESFSNDHLFFKDEGYEGFGDFSIVGDYYHEGGQLPYAVVIHLVYFNDKKELRIHHFISDSNSGPEDVAGKYGEAVAKIKEWHEMGYFMHSTRALAVFLEHAETGYYPGLPTIKKLSIMHHLELINKYLVGEI